MRKRSEFGNEVYTIELATEYNWEDGVVIPFDPWADDAQVIDVYVLEQLSNPYDLSSVERTVFRFDESEHNADIWYNYVPIDAKFREDWQPVDGMPDYYADAPNQEALVRYHIDYVMDQYDYEENWEDEHAFMAKRKAMRRSAAIKKKASNIAWELAERAADGIKERVEYGGYDSDELVDEAVNDALDDGLIYYSDMWKVIEDYGDVQEIWDFIMQDYSVMESLYEDIYSNLGFLVPEGYEDWEDYINKNAEDDDDEYTARRRRASARRAMRRCGSA